MERLSGLDAGFLYMETPSLHMHTLKIGIVDPSTVPGGYTFAKVKEVLAERIHLLPPFRRRLLEVPFGLHHPLWIDDSGFDLNHHVHRIGCPAPGGVREFCELVSDIASRQLERSRPLWELWCVEGLEAEECGVESERSRPTPVVAAKNVAMATENAATRKERTPHVNGQVGFVAKIHHSVADGVAAAALLANVMTTEAEASDVPSAPRWHPERVPSRWELLRDAIADLLLGIRGLPRLLLRSIRSLREVSRRRRSATVSPPVPFTGPRTSFNTALTPHRTFAMTTLGLDEVKAVRKAFGVSVNDVVLAVCAGALRRYLSSRGELPERPLVAGVPTSSGTDSSRLWGNRVSNMFTALRTDIEDPVARLRAIHDVTKEAKEIHNVLGAEMLADWVELTPPRPFAWLMRAYSRLGLAARHRPPINLVVSNVPGPQAPLFVAGARLVGLFSVGPILEGIGLNVTVWSYVGALNVGVIACPEHVPAIWSLVDAMRDSLAELVKAAER